MYIFFIWTFNYEVLLSWLLSACFCFIVLHEEIIFIFQLKHFYDLWVTIFEILEEKMAHFPYKENNKKTGMALSRMHTSTAARAALVFYP